MSLYDKGEAEVDFQPIHELALKEGQHYIVTGLLPEKIQYLLHRMLDGLGGQSRWHKQSHHHHHN
jgi:hypothetical protein